MVIYKYGDLTNHFFFIYYSENIVKMSFCKAPIKRFNENETNTPGPNEYDPKNINGKGTGAGVAMSLKANRFSDKSEATPGPGQYDVRDEKKNVRRSVQVNSSSFRSSFRRPRSPTRSTSSIRSTSSNNSNSTPG